MVSLCSYGFSFYLWVFQGWGFHSVTQNGLEISVPKLVSSTVIHFFLTLQCWDYKHKRPRPAQLSTKDSTHSQLNISFIYWPLLHVLPK